MRYIRLAILLFIYSCNPKRVDEKTLSEAKFGQGRYLKGHLKTFSSNELTTSKCTLDNKIDSNTWKEIVRPNYEAFNSPTLNSFFMFSDQNDIYGYDLFTYQRLEHVDEPYIYLVLIDRNRKLVNHKLIGTIANGEGGVSGEITTQFIDDSTFTTNSDFSQFEVGENEGTFERIVSKFRIDPKGQFILLQSDTTHRAE